MRWVRSRVTFGARLALFALAVQFVLSFGHVHLPTGAATSAWQTFAADTTAPLPAKQRPRSAGNDFCAICAANQLTASSAPTTAPTLFVPDVGRRTWRPTGSVFLLAAEIPRSFQARAPPSA